MPTVAPSAGAWIETQSGNRNYRDQILRVRGLKRNMETMREVIMMSHPLRVRGLKQG